jgi:hypothetical protein
MTGMKVFIPVRLLRWTLPCFVLPNLDRGTGTDSLTGIAEMTVLEADSTNLACWLTACCLACTLTERRKERRCEKEYNGAVMKVHCVYVWSGVYSFRRFCWKTFRKQKQTEWSGDKHTWICSKETIVCNCWTNDCTIDQLDTDNSVQGGIECVHVSPQICLSTCVHQHCKLWVSYSSLNLLIWHLTGWREYEWQSSNML